MSATVFVDTNILVYAASNAVEDQKKRDIARRVLSELEVGFSAQVWQEFYVAAVSKQRLGMTSEDAVAVLASLTRFPVCAVTGHLVLQAIDLRERYQISYWDAAILVAAKQLGCQVVCSEDLNHAQVYDGVKVVNPFKSFPPDS